LYSVLKKSIKNYVKSNFIQKNNNKFISNGKLTIHYYCLPKKYLVPEFMTMVLTEDLVFLSIVISNFSSLSNKLNLCHKPSANPLVMSPAAVI
jgi:hypothetical protein